MREIHPNCECIIELRTDCGYELTVQLRSHNSDLAMAVVNTNEYEVSSKQALFLDLHDQQQVIA